MSSHIYSAILAGDSGVGKSTLAEQYCNHTLPATHPAHVPTLDREFFMKQITQNGQRRTLQIWDISGRAISRAHVCSFFRSATIAFIVFDLTRKSSFHHAEEWCVDAHGELPHEVATLMVLIGNKKDLVDSRVISYHAAMELARKWNMPYFEVSALAVESLDRVFTYAMKEYLVLEQYNISKTLPTKHSPTYRKCKLILVGDHKVGKTALFHMYFDKIDWTQHIVSLHHSYRHRIITLDDNKTIIKLWDTSVHDTDSLTDSQKQVPICCILMYDVTKWTTFTNLTWWFRKLADQRSGGQKYSIVLIGNKCDLIMDRVVSYTQGKSLADSHNAHYVETSAKYGTNVEYAVIMAAVYALINFSGK